MELLIKRIEQIFSKELGAIEREELVIILNEIKRKSRHEGYLEGMGTAESIFTSLLGGKK